MIGSEKPNDWVNFELQSLHVIETGAVNQECYPLYTSFAAILKATVPGTRPLNVVSAAF